MTKTENTEIKFLDGGVVRCGLDGLDFKGELKYDHPDGRSFTGVFEEGDIVEGEGTMGYIDFS